jgi:hypothetical protein
MHGRRRPSPRLPSPAADGHDASLLHSLADAIDTLGSVLASLGMFAQVHGAQHGAPVWAHYAHLQSELSVATNW